MTANFNGMNLIDFGTIDMTNISIENALFMQTQYNLTLEALSTNVFEKK